MRPGVGADGSFRSLGNTTRKARALWSQRSQTAERTIWLGPLASLAAARPARPAAPALQPGRRKLSPTKQANPKTPLRSAGRRSSTRAQDRHRIPRSAEPGLRFARSRPAFRGEDRVRPGPDLPACRARAAVRPVAASVSREARPRPALQTRTRSPLWSAMAGVSAASANARPSTAPVRRGYSARPRSRIESDGNGPAARAQGRERPRATGADSTRNALD